MKPCFSGSLGLVRMRLFPVLHIFLKRSSGARIALAPPERKQNDEPHL